MSARSVILLVLSMASPLSAQYIREATQLDLQGKGAEARAILAQAVTVATTARAKADAQRALAMSWAFEGNCAKAGEYEHMVMLYWISREKEEPGNASYQEGEIADEAGRICIDAGDLAMAEQWYRKGYDAGSKEPGISADRQALWDFRWEHAQARIAARKGTRAEAEKHVAAAKAAIERMTSSRAQQQGFVPYLTGYVAFYLGDYDKALADLSDANQDPFIECLLGQTYEKLGQKDKALDCYRGAAASTAHNPPAAYAIPLSRKKLS